MSASRIDDGFAALMERARHGCPEAVAEILNRYGDHIRRIIRRQLNHRLRSQFDSLDFQQDVWASFFTDDLVKCEFTCPEKLIRYLADMAHSKVIDVFRKRMASSKRNPDREQPLDRKHFDKEPPPVFSRLPSPSQLAIAKERWEQLLDKQTPVHRRILELLRQGHTHTEISKQLGLSSTKFVQRFLHTLKEEGTLP